jgi:hypothetical protein
MKSLVACLMAEGVTIQGLTKNNNIPVTLPPFVAMELLQSQGKLIQLKEMNTRNRIAASSPRRHRTSMRAVSVSVLLLATASCASSFSPRYAFLNPSKQQSCSTSGLSLFAPPGSGYARPEDEESVLPDTYEPMMEYPGTMRPGRTPENMPFQDLPIGDDDPDPVPWPHFQQIEWHHQWEPPHEHPIPMEDFIEMNGRWATAEMEAAMRAGFRRDVRERREQAENEKRDIIITDDDDDEVGEDVDPIALGDGIFGKLGSDADKALTAKATAPPIEGEIVEEEVDESADDEGLDDFLLDLGLDAELEDDVPAKETPTKASTPPPAAAPRKAAAPKSVVADEDDDDDVVESTVDLSFKVRKAASDDDDDDDDDDNEGESIKTSKNGETSAITVDDDSDLDLGLDDEDDMSNDDGSDTAAPDDYSDNDSMETEDEDIFDEGGFDFDDGDFDGGDDW